MALNQVTNRTRKMEDSLQHNTTQKRLYSIRVQFSGICTEWFTYCEFFLCNTEDTDLVTASTDENICLITKHDLR